MAAKSFLPYHLYNALSIGIVLPLYPPSYYFPVNAFVLLYTAAACRRIQTSIGL